jgi:hypothetical protein
LAKTIILLRKLPPGNIFAAPKPSIDHNLIKKSFPRADDEAFLFDFSRKSYIMGPDRIAVKRIAVPDRQ